MHPTLTLIFWLCGLVLAQRLSPFVLAAILAIAVLLSSKGTRMAWTRLIVRSRWLFVILAATTVLMFPGESVRPGLPVTWEGLRLAGGQALRLLAVLFAVGWLLARWEPEKLVEASWGLASLAGLAVARQAALRLALTLEEVGSPKRSRPLWHDLLKVATDPPDADGGHRTSISVPAAPLGPRHIGAAVLAVSVTATLWWSLP